MHLFVLTSDIPYPSHNLEGISAVHIVSRALIDAWRDLGHTVIVQIIYNQSRTQPMLTEQERQALNELRATGVEVAEPIFYEQYNPTPETGLPARAFNRLIRLFRRLFSPPSIVPFYPAASASALIAKRLAVYHPDVAIPIWHPEGTAALYGVKGVRRVIYHGDIDFVPSKVRVDDAEFFTGQPLSPDQRAKSLERLERYKAAHVHLMNQMEVIGNVTASNIPFYKQHGHPQAIYLPNTWIDPGKERAHKIIEAGYQRLVERRQPVKIVGHVGYLNRTGSNYGLRFLANLLPDLDRVMADAGVDYRVHIIGSGDLLPSLKPQLAHPKVILSGYAEDLDQELEDSDVFLFLNNAGPLVAAYTRHIVAWASGLCLIAHTASTRAIPEINHLQNTVVGEVPAQLAEGIRNVIIDPDLNRQIRTAGRATYEQHFTPQHVAAQVIAVIERL